MSLSKKSVSLFEVLPPSQAKAVPAASAAEPEATQNTAKTAPAKTRQSVSIDSSATSAGSETSSTFRPKKETTSNRKLSSHQVAGVSVREKSDPFVLIVACMLALVIISNLVTYRYSYQKGIREGAAISLSQRSQNDLPTRPVNSSTPKPEVTNNNSKTHTASLKTTLPTTYKQLTPEQSRATVPPEELKKYTLQIQTFGRKSITLAKELAMALQKSGLEAFYDKNDGAVFVGRLKSVSSSEAKQLRNEILRFNWRSRDFKKSFYRSIPKHLLEP